MPGGRATSSTSARPTGRGSSPARSARRRSRRRSAPRSTTPAIAASRSTRWPSRTTQQVAALVEAGVDILLPETVIDTLNLKACLFAISRYFDEHGVRVPVMVSGTFDKGGATFVSGQAVEAFWNAVSHFPMLSVGMNCASGPS